jgi:DtxR family Mn-dependent transcriptional regulator
VPLEFRRDFVTEELHPALEEYLETIWSLEEEGIPVIQARVAQRLKRSAPSVSAMLERLEAEGYITRKARRLELTPRGRSLAESVVRKHRLAERLLVDVIGLPWHKAHAEAGRWEHVISDEVEERLVALLGNPSTCPHGNPIPALQQSNVGQAPVDELTPLARMQQGSQAKVMRITEELEMDGAALAYLEASGLLPGAKLELASSSGSQATIKVRVGLEEVEVSTWMAERILVLA